MGMQERLNYLIKEEIKDIISPRLRGVSAIWEKNTAYISFFFDGEISELDREEASEVCTYIISHFPTGCLEESYIRLDYPKPLPERFLVYNRDWDQV